MASKENAGITMFEFKKCPYCACEKTVTNELCQEEVKAGKVSKDVFISLHKEAIPIIEPSQVTGLSVPTIIAHFDVCCECGRGYYTRIEKVQVPIRASFAPKNSMGGMHN